MFLEKKALFSDRIMKSAIFVASGNVVQLEQGLHDIMEFIYGFPIHKLRCVLPYCRSTITYDTSVICPNVC